MKRVAAITMVRGDDFFLRRWVTYYGAQLGKDNLYIYYDGLDQQVPPFCEGTHAQAVEKIGSEVVAAEKGRLKFLSAKAAALLADGYDLVIGADADEFLLPDPALGIGLREYLDRVPVKGSLSALGLDVGQKVGEEGDLSADAPFLGQRRFAVIGPRYTKPSVLSASLVWGSGFHRVKGHNFHIAKDLYLFHFGYSDQAVLRSRLQDADRLSQGWEQHIRRRAKTISLVGEKKARNFEKWTAFARRFQTLVRMPYAWNKPSMAGLKIVVELPQRFRNSL